MDIRNPEGIKSPLFPLIDQFTRDYYGLSTRLTPVIQMYLDQGVEPRKAVLKAFKVLNIQQSIKTAILDNVVTAAAIGYGVGTVADPDGIKATMLHKRWPGQKYTLAESIAKAEYREIIASTVHSEFRKQASFTQLANALTDKGIVKGELPRHLTKLSELSKKLYVGDPLLKKSIAKSIAAVDKLAQNGAPTTKLKAAYYNMAESLKKGSKERFEKAMDRAIKEKARYNAERIARTEIARAYGAANDLRNLEDDDVIGVKFRLSTRHPITDICDYHTKANLYGMGPGVYPKNKRPPYPFHPHCMCVRSQVFVGEVETGDFNAKEGEKWLKSQSEKDQQLMLGKAGEEVFQKGGDWQKVLKNYNGQEAITKSGLKKSFLV